MATKKKIIHPHQQIAKIDDWLDLPRNSGRLYLLPIRQEDHADLAARITSQYKKTDEYVEPPYYITEQPNEKTGEPGERVLWDAKSLEKRGTPEEKEWWANYQRSQQVLAKKTEDASMFMIFVDGTYKYISPSGFEVDLRIDDIDPVFNPPSGWVMKQERMGIELPDNPYDLKYMFVSGLIPDITTSRELVLRCMELSMEGTLTEEALARFRGEVWGQMVRQAKRASEIIAKFAGTIEIPTESNGILELQSEIPGNENGAGMEENAERMG